MFALIYSTTMGQPRDINEVLASYKKQLMSTADVVGVYVGLCEDHRTECIHVMTRRDSPELRRTIPKTLDTYPVVIEISGDVRPLAK